MADGFPAADLKRLVVSFEKTKFERDPKDTFVEPKEVDALASAVWKDAERGIGWKAPNDAWKLEVADADKPSEFTLTKGATTLRVEVRGDGLKKIAVSEIPLLMGRAKGFNPGRDLTQSEIGGKVVLAIRFKTVNPAMSHVRYLVGFDNGTLIAEVESADAIDRAAKDAEEALGGFVYKE